MLQLPLELQLLILSHVKQNNHLDLIPLAQTCKSLSFLVADKYNWSGTVTLLKEPGFSTSSNFLIHALKNSQSSKYATKKLQVVTDNASILPVIIHILQRSDSIEEINLLLPSHLHPIVYETLTQTHIQHLTIRDPTDDGYIMERHHMPILQQFSNTLSKSQLTLRSLDLSSFPSSLLMQQKEYKFPQVTFLSVALIGEDKEDENNEMYWEQLKYMFPSLVELRLTLTKQNSPLFKSLLEKVALFPWIKRLSAQSKESPKEYLCREDLRSSLLLLNGLNRITAGWDMIALN